ncbi:MAG: hypothetical protein O3A46_08340, partial [Candidatus Poribacteria bacterium]|nr:hypothetical protein [Candidatus Poribacteria bacterium]
EFNGRRSVQLVAKDWQIHVEGSLVEHGIFPRREHPTWVKIVDNRERQDKAKYLDRVLRRNEPTLLLVRDDHAIQQARDLLTELGVSDQVGECPFDMSDADRLDRVTRFLNGDWNGLLAVAPLPDLAESAAWGTLRHVIFCHPPESDEAYLKLSSPALTGWGDDKPTTDEDVRYVHLLFNERDLEVDTAKRLALHPDDRTLRRIYKSLRGSATGFTDEQWRDTLDAADKRALDQARTVFEELGLIERNKDDRRVYQTVAAGQRELEDSPAFRRDRITRRAWELHAELYRKRTPRDFWEMLMRHRLNGEPRDDE